MFDQRKTSWTRRGVIRVNLFDCSAPLSCVPHPNLREIRACSRVGKEATKTSVTLRPRVGQAVVSGGIKFDPILRTSCARWCCRCCNGRSAGSRWQRRSRLLCAVFAVRFGVRNCKRTECGLPLARAFAARYASKQASERAAAAQNERARSGCKLLATATSSARQMRVDDDDDSTQFSTAAGSRRPHTNTASIRGASK